MSRQEQLAALMALGTSAPGFCGGSCDSALSLIESGRLLRDAGEVAESDHFKASSQTFPEQRAICAQAQIEYQLLIHRAVLDNNHPPSFENPVSLMRIFLLFSMIILIRTAR